jgi:uncharacterized membrane protein YkoI
MAAIGSLYQVVRAPMFRRHLIPAVLATAVVFGSTASAVYAGSDDSAKELAVLRNAKISLAGAEQKSGGNAISAGLNNENGAMTYGVEVIKGNTVQTVLVDLNSGEVVKVLSADSEPEGSGEQNGQESGD